MTGPPSNRRACRLHMARLRGNLLATMLDIEREETLARCRRSGKTATMRAIGADIERRTGSQVKWIAIDEVVEQFRSQVDGLGIEPRRYETKSSDDSSV